MNTETVDTLIIGGGLSGIYAAYLLSQQNESFMVLEARERLGGRILSPEHEGYFMDLGPSWFWPDIQPKMAFLVRVLGLEGYRQFEEGLGRFQGVNGSVRIISGYAMEPPSWRLSGGMMALVERLCRRIPGEAVRLGHPVCKIEKMPGGVLVHVGGLEEEPRAVFRARKVILALPPRLAAATVLFDPDPGHEMTQAMLRIGTWMSGQAKFFALYKEPFWRRRGLSGEAFSERGPLCEIHDASDNGRPPYGLTGFMGIPAVQRTNRQLVIEGTLSQLAAMFGQEAADPETFFYQDWANERFTATQFDQPPMYEHPLYQPPAGKSSLWDGTILFAGTETADHQGGYLEGALVAAERAAAHILGEEVGI